MKLFVSCIPYDGGKSGISVYVREVVRELCRQGHELTLLVEPSGGPPSSAAEEETAWRESLMEIALQQLRSDQSIHERTRLVFARIAINGEKPDDVAAAFGIERNAVDQMKARMMARLKEFVAALEKADGA